jgi:hypothetical protein
MKPSEIPYRQIRARYDDDTITVYQAYSDTIGKAAVTAQKLNASPEFKLGRMTWIKPSWCWMMYRCGYSYKDNRQTCVLAIKMKHEGFLKILENARLSHGENKNMDAIVVVQWDPERSPNMAKLSYRSIQIGIPSQMTKTWIDEWIVGIEDVTERARKLKAELDENADITVEKLREKGLLPEEKPYEVPDHIRKILQMDKECM